MSLLDNTLFWGLCAGSVAKLAILVGMHRKRPRDLECVGQISDIRLYTVKSLVGTSLQEAYIGYSGLQSLQYGVTDR